MTAGGIACCSSTSRATCRRGSRSCCCWCAACRRRRSRRSVTGRAIPAGGCGRCCRVLFVLLSADEGASLHELLVTPLRRMVGGSPWLRYPLLVPGMAAVLTGALVFGRFLRSWPLRDSPSVPDGRRAVPDWRARGGDRWRMVRSGPARTERHLSAAGDAGGGLRDDRRHHDAARAARASRATSAGGAPGRRRRRQRLPGSRRFCSYMIASASRTRSSSDFALPGSMWAMPTLSASW